jgi:hypothetical protein
MAGLSRRDGETAYLGINSFVVSTNYRHSQNIARHQSLSIIPFEFAIQLPPSRKEGVMMARVVKEGSSTPDVLE